MNGYRSFAVTFVGGNHIKEGKGCQDSSDKYEDDGMVIVAVSDGHGDNNCLRSEKGAAFAVMSAIDGIFRFSKSHESKFRSNLAHEKNVFSQNDRDKAMHDLIRHIIASWQGKVEEDYINNPFTADELSLADAKHRKKYEENKGFNKAYGTTLLACAIIPHYWLGIHIGDGRLTALYPDGSFDQPVPWDEKCYLNVTTSICDDDADINTRYYFSLNVNKPPPVAVFLCSDGIDDNYPVDGNEKHLFELYRTIALTFAEDGFESTCEQLKDLANSYATKGKGDDTSIAGFINMEELKQVVPVWEKQISEENTSADEKEISDAMEVGISDEES